MPWQNIEEWQIPQLCRTLQLFVHGVPVDTPAHSNVSSMPAFCPSFRERDVATAFLLFVGIEGHSEGICFRVPLIFSTIIDPLGGVLQLTALPPDNA